MKKIDWNKFEESNWFLLILICSLTLITLYIFWINSPPSIETPKVGGIIPKEIILNVTSKK